MKDAANLRWSLKSLGLSEAVIDAAWPEWWSEAAEPSISAQSELRFSLSRKLGLEPKSLLLDEPEFIWTDQAKFKGLTCETVHERAALISYGASVGRALLAATPSTSPELEDALSYRNLILKHGSQVNLTSLITLCWSLGVPTVYLRVFPLSAKRMTAMVVRVNQRFAILLAKDANYPAQVAFYIAHELGHAALGHVGADLAVVELADTITRKSDDDDEKAADRYALELLTGMPNPQFEPSGDAYNAPAIAHASLAASSSLNIDPGVIALCFGHTTGAWQRVFSALRLIYGDSLPARNEVNLIAAQQLDWSALNDDTSSFLHSVIGVKPDGTLRP